MKIDRSKSSRKGMNAGVRTLLLALLSFAVLAGCQDSAKHYALRGQVLTKDLNTKQLTVNGDAIPGFMAAMAMPYPVKDLQGLTDVQPGTRSPRTWSSKTTTTTGWSTWSSRIRADAVR